jgi:hypothetical protein
MLKAGPTDTPLNNNNNNSNLNQCYKQQKSWNVATKLNAPGSENVSKYGNCFSKTFLKKWQFSFSKYKRNKWLNIPSLFSFFFLFFFVVTRMRKLATKNKMVVKGVHLHFYKKNINSK